VLRGDEWSPPRKPKEWQFNTINVRHDKQHTSSVANMYLHVNEAHCTKMARGGKSCEVIQ